MPQRLGKLSPEVQQRLLDAIRAGNYITVAARYAGISPSTFYRWLERGRDAKSGAYREFYDEVKQAETYAEIRAVTIIQKAMEDNWRAAVTYLERKFPLRWGSKEKRMANSSRRAESASKGAAGEGKVKYEESQLAQIARVLHEVGALQPPHDGDADPLDS